MRRSRWAHPAATRLPFARIVCGLLLVGTSCAWSAAAPEPASDEFPWLVHGTTRTEVLRQLGQPSHSFAGGRILCFLVAEDEDSGSRRSLTTPTPPWIDGPFSGWGKARFDVVVVIEDEAVVASSIRRLRQ